MGVLVFFSGGLDSVTLATDVAKHPHRYGIHPNGQELRLFAYSGRTRAERDAKRGVLGPIVSWIRKVADPRWGEVKLVVKMCPLRTYAVEEMPDGGHQTLQALASEYRPDIAATPYTGGQLVWAAGYALNMLRHTAPPPHGKHLALFGFQYDGPEWVSHDHGTLADNDASPEFVAALNVVAGVGEDVRFAAPFLDWRLDRTQVVRLGMELGVPFKHTSSCVTGFHAKCGLCAQCMNRQRTFKALGLKE